MFRSSRAYISGDDKGQCSDCKLKLQGELVHI